MQRAQSASFTSAVERFGMAAQALTGEGMSLDEVVRGCGAVTPVDPRPAELAVVRDMSGFTEDGALRVLALRERLLELRRAGLPPFNAVTRMRHQLESMQLRPKRERQEEQVERPAKRALSQPADRGPAAAAEGRDGEDPVREPRVFVHLDEDEEGPAFDMNDALSRLDRAAAAARAGVEGGGGGGGDGGGGGESGGEEDDDDDDDDDDLEDPAGALVAFDEWMPIFGDVNHVFDEEDGDDDGGASGQEADAKRIRLGPR